MVSHLFQRCASFFQATDVPALARCHFVDAEPRRLRLKSQKKRKDKEKEKKKKKTKTRKKKTTGGKSAESWLEVFLAKKCPEELRGKVKDTKE